MIRAMASPDLGVVLWGMRMWTAHSSWLGRLGLARLGRGRWMGRPWELGGAGLWPVVVSFTGANV